MAPRAVYGQSLRVGVSFRLVYIAFSGEGSHLSVQRSTYHSITDIQQGLIGGVSSALRVSCQILYVPQTALAVSKQQSHYQQDSL